MLSTFKDSLLYQAILKQYIAACDELKQLFTELDVCGFRDPETKSKNPKALCANYWYDYQTCCGNCKIPHEQGCPTRNLSCRMFLCNHAAMQLQKKTGKTPDQLKQEILKKYILLELVPQAYFIDTEAHILLTEENNLRNYGSSIALLYNRKNYTFKLRAHINGYPGYVNKEIRIHRKPMTVPEDPVQYYLNQMFLQTDIDVDDSDYTFVRVIVHLYHQSQMDKQKLKREKRKKRYEEGKG